MNVLDPCVYCGESTAFGSGRFVNRTPADADGDSSYSGKYEDGYACSDCLCYECDRCKQMIGFDEDIGAYQCGLEEFSDGAFRICSECMTPTEIKQQEANEDKW